VSSNPAHGEVYSIQHYVIKFVSDKTWFSPGALVSSTYKTIFFPFYCLNKAPKYFVQDNFLWLVLGYGVTPLSTIFLLYRGGKFYQWRKPGHLEKTRFCHWQTFSSQIWLASLWFRGSVLFALVIYSAESVNHWETSWSFTTTCQCVISAYHH
jgi:hypothetical protein